MLSVIVVDWGGRSSRQDGWSGAMTTELAGLPLRKSAYTVMPVGRSGAPFAKLRQLS